MLRYGWNMGHEMKITALTVPQEALDAIFETMDDDDKNGVIGSAHCKALKVLRRELEAREKTTESEE